MDENKQSIGKRLFTTVEAAVYLNVKTQTLANWRHTRQNLNYIKIGRKVMYEQSELERCISEKRIVLCD